MEEFTTCGCEITRPILSTATCAWSINELREIRHLLLIPSETAMDGDIDCKFEWKATACIKAQNPGGDEHLYFSVCDSKIDDVSIILRKYRIRHVNGTIYEKTFFDKTCHPDPLITMNEIGGYLASTNELVIICDVIVYGDIVHTQQPKFAVPVCIRENLGRLFESREFSDVAIVCPQQEEIRAHKAILAAESTVFSEMIKNGTMGSFDIRIEIMDVEHDVLKEMLRFLYGGQTKELQDMALDLLIAAEKYDLQTLKITCEAAMCKKISIENAADMLILAYRYRAGNFKMSVIDFILRHFKKVVITEGFKRMKQSHGFLLGELTGQMVA